MSVIHGVLASLAKAGPRPVERLIAAGASYLAGYKAATSNIQMNGLYGYAYYQKTILNMASSLGGGQVITYSHRSISDSVNYCLANAFGADITNYDWCSAAGYSGKLFAEFNFPRKVYVEKIFFMRRSYNDNFPTYIELWVDGVYIATYNQTTISNADGLSIVTYNNVGYYLNPKISGTQWTFKFGGSQVYIGEVEFQGY